MLSKDEDNYYFFINGELICTNPVKGKTAFYGVGTPRALIASRTNYHKKPKAVIDDIHLYDRALSQQEVEALFGGNTPNSKNIEIAVNSQSLCSGETVIVSTNADASTQVKWTVNPAIVPPQTSSTLKLSLPKQDTDYTLVIEAETVSDSTACFPEKGQFVSKTIRVKACPVLPLPSLTDVSRLFIPSAFTPNGDGMNDDFKITNWEKFKDFKIWIYSRWGEVIFYSSGYETFWNGKYLEKLVPTGIYLYKIISEKKEIDSGIITVLY